jgi:hypothetical protein
MDDSRLEPWKLLMTACKASGGVVTASQATALGLERGFLPRLVSSGTVVREWQGVYRLAAYPLGRDQRLRIASHIGGVISHETVGVLLGYEGFGDAQVHVTVPHGFLVTAPAWVSIHETRRPVTGSTRVIRGVACTGPLRTVLDLAGRPIADQTLERFVSHCLSGRHFTIRRLERFTSEHGKNARGIRRLKSIVGALSDVGSLAEADLLAVLATAGIDRPVTQFELRDGSRLVARIDIAWPVQRVALELDGYRYHADARTFVSDRERGNRIVSMGWTLLRTTPTAVRERPQEVVNDVRAALRRAA